MILKLNYDVFFNTLMAQQAFSCKYYISTQYFNYNKNIH